jgi:hypothetical protein
MPTDGTANAKVERRLAAILARELGVRYVLTVDARVEALDVLFGGHVGYDVRKHLTKFVECCLFAMRGLYADV